MLVVLLLVSPIDCIALVGADRIVAFLLLILETHNSYVRFHAVSLCFYCHVHLLIPILVSITTLLLCAGDTASAVHLVSPCGF